ncbi:MAG: hypothetical protein ACM31C_02125 [Acidobacteriota bacterium]
MKHARRGGSGAGAGAPNAGTGLIDDEDPQHDHAPPPPVHVEPHAPHPTAMLAYVDHDHEHPQAPAPQHDQKLTPEQQAAVDKMLAATRSVAQTVLGLGAEQKVKSSIKDTQAVAIGMELATYSRGMSDAASKAFIQRLDSLDDPELRHKVMAQFEAQTGQKLEDFIKGCSDWNNNGDGRDKAAALQLISPERDKADAALADMKPEDREAARAQAKQDADAFLLATSKRDHSDANSQKIFRLMEKKSPAEMELFRAAIREQSLGEHNLYERIDYGMHDGDEDEAVAMMAGDHVSNARMALINETDPKRFEEAVNNLTDDERKKLNEEPFKSMALSRIKNPSDRAVVEASIAGNKDLAEGERLGNLMKPKDEGLQIGVGVYDEVGNQNYDRRKAGNVLREFEGMSGEQVKAAVAAWDQAHPDRPMEKMLEERWGNDDDKTEYLRLKAMMEGDKGKDRSLRLEESIRKGDQEEREAALTHEKVDDAALHSKDDKVRKHAEEVQAENESFERNNVEYDHEKREAMNMLTGRHDDTTGHSTKEQLQAYFAEQKAKDVDASYDETMLRAYGNDPDADKVHAADRKKHERKVDDLDIAAMELLDDGKLSPETEFHRGKGAKEKAEALENISSNKDLEAAQQAYKEKYGEDMLPDPKKDRSDMNANELMIDNVRRYGARAERPAQVEAMLQIQQYEKQYSSSLEADEDGGGTQDYQRILIERQRRMLADPKFAVHAPKTVTELNGVPLPFPQLVEDPNEPKFEDTQAAIDKLQAQAGGDIHKVDDGLKQGIKKSEFNAVDKQLVKANAAQEEAKKALAERWIKIISTIAKIAAVLTANPWLIAAIDIGEGLIEMGIKHQVMGEAYDPSDDLKMLAITGAADIALMGFSKLGELKGAAKLGEAEAVSVAEKAAMEVEHATTAEAKSQAFREAAHVAAGENKALQGAIEAGSSTEKALGKEVASEAGHKVEQKVADAAEGKVVHEGEGAAAKAAESEVGQGAHAMEEAEKAAEQIKARYGMLGGAAKMGITTVGGGVVQGKSPSEILKGLVTGGLGLLLPGRLAEKVKGAIGNETLAAKVLGELASFGTEVTTNTTINVAGGADGSGALLDSALGAAGGRAQHAFAGHGAGTAAEEEHAPGHDESTAVHENPAVSEDPPIVSKDIVAGGPQHGSPHIELRAGGADHRLAANAPRTVERASSKLAAMDEQARAQHQELFAKTENRGQQVLLERAVAAGASFEDLEKLVGAMSGMGEEEALREFSGAGLVQLYAQSCVPTSYQIAIAEANPVAAHRMRNRPDEMMVMQRDALVRAGGAQTPRNDLAAAPPALQEMMSQLELRAALNDANSYNAYAANGHPYGIDPTEMRGQPLHKELEDVTGSKYEVITNDTYPFPSSDGQYSPNMIPHDRIAKALDSQQPVMFGMGGHQRAILGRDKGNGSDFYYIVEDPDHGGTVRIRAGDLDHMDVANIILPAEAQPPGPVLAPSAGASVVGTPARDAAKPIAVGAMREVPPEQREIVPHDELRPVLVGPTGREAIVTAVHAGPDGMTYELFDPMTGQTRVVPQRDVDDVGPRPANDAPAPAVLDEEPAAEESPAHPLPATGTNDLASQTIDSLGESELVHRERIDRPTPAESESRVSDVELEGLPFRDQVSLRQGKEVPYGTAGSTRPDNYSAALAVSVEVKNYDLGSARGEHKLIQNVVGQAQRREGHLPRGTEQKVMIDIRGQTVSPEQQARLRVRIAESSDGRITAENIRFITDDEAAED